MTSGLPGTYELDGSLMNRIDLAPGQAVFLPAGNMHAYLSGFGVVFADPARRSGAGRSTPQRFPSSTPWTPRSPGSRSGAATSPASRRTPS